MKEARLIAAFLLVGICGDWIMGRADRFLNEHVKGEEDEQQR